MSGRGKGSNKPKEGVVLLLDVGQEVGVQDSDGQSFLNKSKKCASRIIQRKIFSDTTDNFSLILIGSETTDNELDYPNIKVVNKWLCAPNWNLLRDIENLTVTGISDADWLDGLIVAINLLKSESECKRFTALKIVMVSNFAAPIRSRDQVEDAIEALKELKINLVVIGPESEDQDSENQQKSNAQRKGEAVIGRIVDEADGVMCGFYEAMSQLDHFQKVTAKPAAWNCDLQIGEDVFIPITGFKKFGAKNILKWNKRSIDGSPITVESVYFQGDKQVEKEDVIFSYLFGQTVVPFSDEDKSSMSLVTEKCFQLIGFTKKQNVPCHIFLGDSAFYITPRNGVEGAAKAITSLATALLELQMVGIVRRVYCKNTAPRLGALVPTCENGCYFFYWIQLPFAEDERRITLPSLRNINPSQEQLEAVDKLIDAMDLEQFGEDEDPYSQLIDPAVEHMNNLIVFRAMNPSMEFPTEPSEAIQNMLKPKPEILKNASEALENIKKLFPLEEIEQKTYRKGAADVFNRTSNSDMEVEDVKPENLVDCMANFVQSSVTEVGTVDPEGNFLKLLKRGEPFGNLCEQMQIAIKKLVLISSNPVGMNKSIPALALLRKHCVSKNTASYNQFIATLKDDLVERENTDFWNMIVQERLGLITSEESQQSNVTASEADVFYEMKKIEAQDEVNYEMEAEDLLDEL